MKAQFFFQHKSISLINRTSLKLFIETIFKKEKQPLDSLNYIFCSDKDLLQINKDFLSHNFYTDIITFNLSDIPNRVQGEIYISVDRVKDNAQKFNTTIKEELHRVIFHGALHLCGYKDKTKSEAIAMRAAESKYLLAYFG